VIALGILVACAQGSTLTVQLATDLRAGTDIDGVHVRVRDSGGAMVGTSTFDLASRRGVGRPVRIGAFDVPPGRYTVDVTLTLGSATVQSRTARTMVSGNSYLTLLMVRDCTGVTCPGAADDPASVACLGGRCTSPDCSEDNPSACPTPRCHADSECPASVVGCVASRCSSSGICWRSPDDAACGTGSTCDVALGCVTSPTGAPAALTHQYRLTGGYGDDLGGPALVPSGGTLGANGYTFGPNQGLSVTGAMPQNEYTVDLLFSFDMIGSWRKIIDFKDLTTDEGFYTFDPNLQFVVVAGSVFATGTANFPQSLLQHVALTRDATGMTRGYLEGQEQFSFMDTGNVATLTGPGAVVHFFIDDVVTSMNESSGGVVQRIRIFDRALLPAEIPS
jgi:hypothetical protein